MVLQEPPRQVGLTSSLSRAIFSEGMPPVEPFIGEFLGLEREMGSSAFSFESVNRNRFRPRLHARRSNLFQEMVRREYNEGQTDSSGIASLELRGGIESLPVRVGRTAEESFTQDRRFSTRK